MGVLTWHDKEIEELSKRLDGRVKKAYYEIVKDEAKELAEELIDSMGLDAVCRDIDDAISEAEDWIHERADRLVTYTFDNYLLATFAPYPEYQEVDEDVIGELSCGGEFSVDRVITNYAYELWRVGIRKELEEILKEKCAGVVKRSLARIRAR